MTIETDELPPMEEYETSGEEYWQVNAWPGLAAAFSLKATDLPLWHDTFAGQGRMWEMMRRIYRIAPVMLDSDVYLREWTITEVAESMGVAETLLQGEFSKVVSHWQGIRANDQVKQDVGAISDEDIAHLTRFSDGDGMGDEVIQRLLKAFNFEHIQKDPVLRAEVASRIVSLKDWLNSPHTRTSARELIRMEITMHGMDKMLIVYRNKIAELLEKEVLSKDDFTEMKGLEDRLGALEKQMRSTSEAHQKKQEAIGADDLDMTARKRIYTETVSQLVEMCAEYESDPENYKIDGVFTAREIEWLVEPKGERDPQYRFDVVMAINEAMQPENLWNSQYKPTKVTRRVCQDLARIIKTVREVPADAPDLPDPEDEEELVGMDAPVMGPVEDGDALATAAARTPVAQEGETVMGVYS